MPLVSMRQLLDEAAKGGYGVGAFNVNDMEQIQAIMEAATETQSPVIDIMEALKKSLAEKRKPAMVATAAASSETDEVEAAPKKRARKSKVG